MRRTGVGTIWICPDMTKWDGGSGGGYMPCGDAFGEYFIADEEVGRGVRDRL